jgi:uncharacterized membrane protein
MTAPKQSRAGTLLHRLKEAFRNYFMAGLLTLVPLLVTLWVLRFIIQTMDNIFLPAVLRVVLPDVTLPNHYYGLGALFTIVIVLLAGAFARSFIAGRMMSLGESFIARIPFVRNVYGAVKQLMETVVRKEHKDFRGVALVPFPHPGVYSVGFVTGRAAGEVQTKTRENVINVFIPTTPNPTTGFYIMMPVEKTIPLEMTVEEAFKLVMSGGIVVPPERAPAGASATVRPSGFEAPIAPPAAPGEPSRAEG